MEDPGPCMEEGQWWRKRAEKPNMGQKGRVGEGGGEMSSVQNTKEEEQRSSALYRDPFKSAT